MIVIDLHLAWCGPCDVMENNYRSLFFNIVDAAERISFFTASAEVIPEEFLTKLKCGVLTCKPRFAIFLEGELKCEIDGADFTTMEEQVNKLLPAQEEQ